jgi:hypothetical protein
MDIVLEKIAVGSAVNGIMISGQHDERRKVEFKRRTSGADVDHDWGDSR